MLHASYFADRIACPSEFLGRLTPSCPFEIRPHQHFEPEKFEDRYEDSLKELLERKRGGKPIERPERPKPTNVVNLMDALRRSVEAGGSSGSAKRKTAPERHRAVEKADHPKRKKARR